VTGAETAAASWRDFWSRSHSIYVNERHARIHYARIADDLARLIGAERAERVLDWGCGDALSAPVAAARCGTLFLFDAVEPVQARLHARFAGEPNIRVLDSRAWAAIPDASIDLVVMNSVAQYLSRAELGQVLHDFRRVVRPAGAVIFADIIPPHQTPAADVAALLRPALANGYFLPALAGLVRTYFSDYRTLRATAGFSCYSEAAFIELLAGHGFDAERLNRNIGFSAHRMAFRARPRLTAP